MKKLVLMGEGRDVVGRGGLLYPDAGRVQYWELVEEAALPRRASAGTSRAVLGPGPLLSRRLSTAELDREEFRVRLRIAAAGGNCAPRRGPSAVQTCCPACFTPLRLTTARGPCAGCGALVDRRGRVVA
jgi:hypothetical protein